MLFDYTTVTPESITADVDRTLPRLEAAAYGEIMLVAIPFTRLSHMIFSPLTRAYMGSEFGKVRHAVPMLSLGNAFADEEVAEFVGRIRRFLKLADDEPVAITAEEILAARGRKRSSPGLLRDADGQTVVRTSSGGSEKM